VKSRASLNQPAATRALCELRLAALDAHPDNPRLVTRDDVVESIARQLTASGEYGQEHAILVRPVGERYQIIAGHHRVAAARAAGFATIWGWVRDLDDERAFMELVLANAQGELAPLEIGLHALRAVPLGDGGRGKKGGLSDYAKAIGKTKQYVSQLRDAATVLTSVKPSTQVDSLLAAAKHLHAIHAADPRAWPALVAALLRDDARATRHAARPATIPATVGAGEGSSSGPSSSPTRSTETTCSPGAVLMTMTPWVERPALRMPCTGQRINWPPSVTSMIWSLSSTGKEATSGPLRSLTAMATMPLPPRLVMRYSYDEVRLP